MIDSHVHLLPGVDDGAKDFAQSLEMLEKAKADGITHWVVTPHLNHACSKYSYEELMVKFVQWREAILQNNAYDRILFGVEVYVDEAFLNEISVMHPLPTFENSNYMLIEFNKSTKFEMMQATIHELRMRQITPIMAHVEAYKTLVNNPEYVKTMCDEGALIQVSANSFMDKRYRAFIKTLIQLNAIDLVASDGHNLRDRKPLLSKAYNRVVRSYSEEWADRLFIESPRTVYSGIKYFRPLTMTAPKRGYYFGFGVAAVATLAIIFFGASQLDGFNNNGVGPLEIAIEDTTEETTQVTDENEASEEFNLTDESVAAGAVDPNEVQATTAETLTNAATTQESSQNAGELPPLYGAIKEDYVSQLYVLQNQYTADVKRIYNAIQDTRNFVTDEAKRKEIINAYLEEVGTLETICDRKVYDLLYDFQNELEKYEYDVSEIEEIRAEYLRIKEETRNAYLNDL